MSQSKWMSFVEAVTNTMIGLVIAFVLNAFLMAAAGVTATATQNALIVVGHTVVSVLRSYFIRRMFNGGWRAALDRVLTCHERYRSGRRW